MHVGDHKETWPLRSKVFKNYLAGLFHKKNLNIKWWGWLLAILCIMYWIFVLEAIVSFLYEDAPKAALVMGLIAGFPALVWSVLLGRFVFRKPASSDTPRKEIKTDHNN